MRISSLLFPVLSTALACAQQTPPAAENPAPQDQEKENLGRITGRTVNALTGEPVPKVRLILRRVVMGGRNLGAVSDAESHFVVEKVEPGTYYLQAERAGFLRRAYSSRRSGSIPTPLTLTTGQEIKDLEFKLMPQGVINGKVLDEDGEPVRDATINVFRQASSAGRGHITGAGMGTSNDAGEFRIANLAAGRYIIQAAADYDLPGQEAPKPKEGEIREACVATFYPGVTDLASAAAVEIGPGQEVSGIAIPLRKSRVYSISGIAAGATPDELKMLNVSLLARVSRLRPLISAVVYPKVAPDGSFTLTNVQPGSYYVTLALVDGGRPRVVGRTAVDVAESDVEGVSVPVGHGITVNGRVGFELKGKADVAGLQVTLQTASDMEDSTYYPVVRQDGTFRIDKVPPDRYNVSAAGLPEGTYLKTVRFGNQANSDQSVDLSQAEGNATIEVVLSPGAGTVEGSVKEDGEPAPGASVLLVPDPPRAEAWFQWRLSNTDQNGKFSVKGLAPGKYRLYASAESLTPAMDDSEFLKPLEEKAVAVTVAEKAREHVELELETPREPEIR